MISIRLKRQQRQFFIGCSLVLAALGVWITLKNPSTKANVLLSVAVVLTTLELFFNKFATKLFDAWMAFARVLGVVNTHILLTLCYFLLIAPLAKLKGLSKNPKREDEGYRNQKSSWMRIDVSQQREQYLKSY